MTPTLLGKPAISVAFFLPGRGGSLRDGAAYLSEVTTASPAAVATSAKGEEQRPSEDSI
jgi:hypothetical protein